METTGQSSAQSSWCSSTALSKRDNPIKRQKVLILAPFLPPNIGGAETFAQALIDFMVQHYNVLVVTSGFSGVFAGTGLREFLAIFPSMLRRALPLVGKADIVLANGLLSALVALALRFLGKYEVRCVLLALYQPQSKQGLFRLLMGEVLSRCDKIYVEGQGGEDDLACLHIPKERIVQFQHWVDQDVFKPVNRVNSKLRVLFMGRPIKEKGKHIIEQAQQKIANPNIEFIYVENVPVKDLPKYYQMADILVVPSQYAEGFVRVVAEGASCGCVVISSDRGSLPELVRPFGMIADDVDDFVWTIEYFHNNRWMLENMRKQTIEYAKETFSVKNAEVFL